MSGMKENIRNDKYIYDYNIKEGGQWHPRGCKVSVLHLG